METKYQRARYGTITSGTWIVAPLILPGTSSTAAIGTILGNGPAMYRRWIAFASALGRPPEYLARIRSARP